jgi:hypothetical protein
MSTNPVALLRQRAPSLYSEFLPADIRYRNAAGHSEIVALESATVDELAFAIQTLHREVSVITRQRVALEDLYTALRLRLARGADRVIDVKLEG